MQQPVLQQRGDLLYELGTRGGGLRSPRGDGDDLGARLESQLPHADEVLRDLCQPLLILMHQELGPVRQMLIHLSDRVFVRNASHHFVLHPTSDPIALEPSA